MTNLQEALFPPIEEEEKDSEKVIFGLFDEIKARPREGLALTAAVLVQQEIDMWKQRIADLESRAETRPTPPQPSPAVIADDDEENTVVTHDDEPFPDVEEAWHLDIVEEDSSADQ